MQPKIYFLHNHDIDPKLIDSDALNVLERLRQAGFVAYLVGGSVRDLLLKRIPKDFDISTSATPEQIKKIFQRQCILIGRRFRLAHIHFGHKIMEVSTFRSGENENDLIIQDNIWGTPEQDVLRRDFTINGLFYDSSNNTVIDFVNGWEDIHKHVLRTIGEPKKRFTQDPVRMLRLLKFRARFKFNIDEETNEAIRTCWPDIVKSSSARILEEILRMFESGAAAPFIRLLDEYKILPLLFPSLMPYLRKGLGQKIYHYLSCADQINLHKGKNVLDRSVLVACLFYPILEKEIEKNYLSLNQLPHLGEITLLIFSLVKNILINSFSHFPKRITSMMASLLVTQYRLTTLSGKKLKKEKMFRYKEFEFALQFLKLRALVDEKYVEVYTTTRNQYRHFKQNDHKHHNPPPHKHPVPNKQNTIKNE